MSSLDDLRALGEFPAVEEWERQSGGPAGEGLTGYLKDYADAALEEVADELVTAKRLNGKWMDERTEAIIRADKAEYAAKENREAMNNAVAAWKQAEAEAREWAESFKQAEQSIVELQAEVARLEWMLDYALREWERGEIPPDDAADLAARYEAEHK